MTGRRSTEPMDFAEKVHHQLATVLQDSNDAILLCDFQGVIRSWNRGAEKIYGYSSQEAVGMNIHRLAPEDEWAAVSVFLDGLKNGKNVASFETRRRTRDGRMLDMWLTVTPVLDDERRRIGLVSTERDITERRRSRETLASSERSFRDLVESLHTGISIYQAGRVIYMNPAYRTLLGSLSGLFEPPDYRAIHPEDVPLVRWFYEPLLRGETQSDDLEFRFFPADESTGRLGMKWVQCRGLRFRYADEEALLFHFIETTSTREIEHLMSIQDRMASLGHIAATITHDIRNALSSLNIYLSTLQKTFSGEPGREKENRILEKMRGASNQIESVIKTSTDFTRPGQPNLQRCNLNDLVEETLDLCASSLTKSGVKITKDLAEALPFVTLDSTLIKRVLVNLIMNAIEAMDQSGQEVREIRLDSCRKNNHVILRVSDSGPGVPTKLRKTVFEPFFTTKDGGMGIGLAISFRIIQDHGGWLYVTENPGVGAAFVIEFPLKREPGQA